ncbi:MAG: ATP-binding protein [Candidatus Hydrogenedentes bacterium]|nr:ATP-binding protein [Candidatus Hydrogenedentota bacterium]
MRDDLYLKVASDARLLCAIRGLMRGYLERHDYEEDRIQEIVLALDEACANAIRHSYEGKNDQYIEVLVCSDAARIEICLKDQGKPTNEDKLNKRVPEAPDPGNLKAGGLGIPLIYAIFDEVRFEPGKTRGNCTTLRLNRPSSGPDETARTS